MYRYDYNLADPIYARGYGAERREILERRGAALMG
jgi:hypothetical protein